MLGALAKRIFGSSNDRFVKRLQPRVAEVNALEPTISAMSDEQLANQTVLFRERLEKGETLDDLLVEAFATVREAAKRVLGQRHFDVQLMGGMVQHAGMISEMKTGEGKTLVSTAPGYLNALSGKGVHVVTVNDYLASRDAEWMGRVYRFLGMTVGCIVHGLSDFERREQYACDVTYATNNELGFDYLRDNMKFQLNEMVHRDFNFAIVDEVDSILIDEARTPLIISGAAENASELYTTVNALMATLEPADYEKDEKQRSATLTEVGQEKFELMLRERGMLTDGNLYDIENISLVHHLNQALRANVLFKRDTDYMVRDNKVVIIDEFTGRALEGRRYSEGLHQALEAKEAVEIQTENQTLASITFQNFFRMYPKLGGMTGTALTEAGEFAEIYKLEVIEIPTNVPVARKDADDEVYRSLREKNEAIATQIGECRARNQPVLVGTVSIEKSEQLSELLTQKKIPHHVLNARYHEQEAYIVAQAGKPGAVTIATNMAGRGTDIQLGGNLDMLLKQMEVAHTGDAEQLQQSRDALSAQLALDKATVRAAGGLYVIGTERHESRRIDNQLRGRSGRQGDPGASKFFVSLEDDLMRIFGSERMDAMLTRLGLKEGEAIIHPWINKALEKAQEKVEARNFDIRKNLLKYDDVMNDQRKVVYEQRRDIMLAEDVADTIAEMRHDIVSGLVTRAIPPNALPEQWNMDGLHEEVLRVTGLDLPVQDWAKEEGIAEPEILSRVQEAADRRMAEKAANWGPDLVRYAEKSILLQLLDQAWKDHLLTLDHLRQGIGLRAYAQRDPLNEYKGEAFELFDAMLGRLREQVTTALFHVEVQQQMPEPSPDSSQWLETRQDPAFADSAPVPSDAEIAAAVAPARRALPAIDQNDPATWGKVARNAPCPCGSGKKYKQCHGAFG